MRSRHLLALVTIFTGSVPPSALGSIAYTMKTVERWDAQCPAPTDRFLCAHITFTCPVIEPASRSAAAAINRAVSDFLLTSVGEPRRYQSIEAEMGAFMYAAREYQKIAGARGAYWEERTVAVPYQSETIVSLQFDLSFFSGGLHPSYASTFTSFNGMTGARLRLPDVLVADYEPRLAQIAEKKFRESNGIKPGTSLRDAGYIFFKH